jgi:glycosyltransferase involved in cell wall biosynthesis
LCRNHTVIDTINVIVISAVYYPEPVVSARMAHDLATYLAEKGTGVTVLCPQPSRPMNADYGEFINPGISSVSKEGRVKVIRLPSFAAPQSRMFARLRESASFGWHVNQYLKSLAVRPDALYVNSWPLLSQALIVRCAQKLGIPLVLQIMDIYPESLLNRLPALIRVLLERLLRLVDEFIAHKAACICVISENMRQTYIRSRHISSQRVVTINTWQDEELFEAPADRCAACVRYGVPDNRFTFLFLGNIGSVASVDVLIRGFYKASLDTCQLLIVGDGSEKAICTDLVRCIGAQNILFISDSEVANVPLLQSMADVCLLPMKRGAALSSIPSKLPAYMFSAKPVLAMVDAGSDTERIIQEADCGWVGTPEDIDWLAATMKGIVEIPKEKLSALGLNGRHFGLKHFSKTRGVERLTQLVLSSIPAKNDRQPDGINHKA